MSTITLTKGTGEQITLPASTVRSYGVSAMEPGAVRLIGAIDPVVPIAAVILLKADGSWHHVHTEYGHDNHYWHFDYVPRLYDAESNEHYDALPEPTEAQQRAVARWFFLRERPYDIPLGGPVASWAFGGAAPREVAARYGYEVPPLA